MELNKSTLKHILAGAVFGLFWFVVIRALFAYPEPLHYHANFAVFIDGEQQMFESPIFYEEVQACTQDEQSNPRGRVHLHQPDHDVVHVHDDGATWGNFFENLGWSLGDSFIRANGQTHTDDSENELVFVLNGERTRSIANRVIGNEDTLLISSGGNIDDDLLQSQRDAIPDNAAEYNTHDDPASCSGSAEPSILQRLRFGLLG